MPRRAAAAPLSTGGGTGAAEGPRLRLPRGLTVGFPGGRASGSVDELVARERPLSTRPAPADPASRRPLPTTARGGCGSSRVGHPATARGLFPPGGAHGLPWKRRGRPTRTAWSADRHPAREARRPLFAPPPVRPPRLPPCDEATGSGGASGARGGARFDSPLVSRVYEQILLREAGTVSIWSPHEHLAIDVCN